MHPLISVGKPIFPKSPCYHTPLSQQNHRTKSATICWLWHWFDLRLVIIDRYHVTQDKNKPENVLLFWNVWKQIDVIGFSSVVTGEQLCIHASLTCNLCLPQILNRKTWTGFSYICFVTSNSQISRFQLPCNISLLFYFIKYWMLVT